MTKTLYLSAALALAMTPAGCLLDSIEHGEDDLAQSDEKGPQPSPDQGPTPTDVVDIGYYPDTGPLPVDIGYPELPPDPVDAGYDPELPPEPTDVAPEPWDVPPGPDGDVDVDPPPDDAAPWDAPPAPTDVAPEPWDVPPGPDGYVDVPPWDGAPWDVPPAPDGYVDVPPVDAEPWDVPPGPDGYVDIGLPPDAGPEPWDVPPAPDAGASPDPECLVDSDCLGFGVGSASCVEGLCSPGFCASDEDCAGDGVVCGADVYGRVCVWSGSKALGEPCGASDECESGYCNGISPERVCVAPCFESADCGGAGESCSSPPSPDAELFPFCQADPCECAETEYCSLYGGCAPAPPPWGGTCLMYGFCE